jgi:hypothetical protein
MSLIFFEQPPGILRCDSWFPSVGIVDGFRRDSRRYREFRQRSVNAECVRGPRPDRLEQVRRLELGGSGIAEGWDANTTL